MGLCPHDPEARCGSAPCTCLYAKTGLPEHFYKGGTHGEHIMTSRYGASCSALDMIEGTPWYSYCDVSEGADICANSWCLQKWCYVDEKCPTSESITNSGWLSPELLANTTTMHYSYEACGNPDCFTSTDDPRCPYDPRGIYGCDSVTCGEIKDFY